MVEPAVALAGPVLPSPPDNLNTLVKRTQWIRSRPIHRVHHQQFAADAFNPGVKGNARFSPIRDSAGRPIPTLYGGTSMACAAMETVFHDVPFAPGLKTYDRSKLESQRYAVFEAQRDLLLADLSNVPLRKLGIGRSQLIDTEADHYPYTRTWATAIHEQCLDLDGLCWVSRQHDREIAVMLFGDCVDPKDIKQVEGPASLTGDVKVYASIVDLALDLGVSLV